MIGGSDQDNPFNWPNEMGKNNNAGDSLQQQLDLLASKGGNAIRCVLSCRQSEKSINGSDPSWAWPWKNTGTTTSPTYDVTQFDSAWFTRLNDFLSMAQSRDIVVLMEFWDKFDWKNNSDENPWAVHPFRPANNSNFTLSELNVDTWDPSDNSPNPAFYAPPNISHPDLNNDSLILGHLESFVDRVLDETLQFDNVLFTDSNEIIMPTAYHEHWATFIQNRYSNAGRTAFVAPMPNDPDLTSSNHQPLFNASFPDHHNLSQIHRDGDQHWNDLQLAFTETQSDRPLTVGKFANAWFG